MRHILAHSLTFALLLLVLSATPKVSAQLLFEGCESTGGILTFGAPVVQTITVPTVVAATDAQVLVDLTHPFVGSLDIDLTGANSSSVRLHAQLGSFNDNLDLIFADSGIANGSASYTCECLMQPSGPGTLSDLMSGSVDGDWTLTVTDNFTGDDGDLSQWCLFLFDQTPPAPVSSLGCLSIPGTGFADISWTNSTTYDSINIYVNGALTEVLAGSATIYTTPTFPTPSSLTVEVEGVVGGLAAVGIVCNITLQETGATQGPDVVLADCTSVVHLGELGGIHSYAMGSLTCNRGPANLTWGVTSPLMAQNAFRLHDGRLEQIGMGWVKNGTAAAALNGCGLNCNGQGGSVLGAGCLDVYSASFNGTSSVLGPRSNVNAFNGDYPGPSGTITTVLDKRIQIAETDLSEPLAQFFVEGVYVAFEDAANGNAHNNASYKPVEVDGVSFEMTPTGAIAEGQAAIYAWAEHGLGPGIPDPSVTIREVDVPGEGRFFVGTQVSDLGAGLFRYEYAVYNLNSHRSAGSFEIPLSLGANVTNVGFHDVDYHTGEPYDNSDWNVTVGAGSITWSSPETFAQNPNSNALRWATLYNFWFDAELPPADSDATLGLFRPGTPDTLTVVVSAPFSNVTPSFIRGDVNGDFAVSGLIDGLYLLNYGFNAGAPPPCLDAADVGDDGNLNALVDALILLSFQFSGGPPPAAPYPDCGVDGTPATSVGCATLCP